MSADYICYPDGTIEWRSARNTGISAMPCFWYEHAAAFWLITIVIALLLGGAMGWIALPAVMEGSTGELEDLVSAYGPVAVLVGCVAGTVIYGLKCQARRDQIYGLANYGLSASTSAVFGALTVPVLIIIGAIIVIGLALLILTVIGLILSVFD